MNESDNPQASDQSGKRTAGGSMCFGGLALLSIVLGIIFINGMIARNNQMIIQNQLQNQELRRQMQKTDRQRIYHNTGGFQP